MGDTLAWHVLNASADAHPMHLHGFYYLVDHKGDGLIDSVFSASQRRQVNTESLPPGTTTSLTWVPERPGNWLFHCHLPDHFSARAGMGMVRPPKTPDEMRAHASMNHATTGMNGLVIGVTVHGKALNVARATSEQPRDIRLVIRPSVGGTVSQPLYRFALDAGGPAPMDSGLHLGPSLVLTRGQPVRITVVNTLDAQSSVHWHGIKLDSYYDGVGGFNADAQHLAPVIARQPTP